MNAEAPFLIGFGFAQEYLYWAYYDLLDGGHFYPSSEIVNTYYGQRSSFSLQSLANLRNNMGIILSYFHQNIELD